MRTGSIIRLAPLVDFIGRISEPYGYLKAVRIALSLENTEKTKNHPDLGKDYWLCFRQGFGGYLQGKGAASARGAFDFDFPAMRYKNITGNT